MPSSKVTVTMVTERKIILVQPGYTVASAPRVEVNVCVTCSAVVFDPIVHDQWHRAMECPNAFHPFDHKCGLCGFQR